MMEIEEPIKTTVEEIRKFLNVKNVVGKTIETDEHLMIPFTKMGMGFAAGKGNGSMDNNSLKGEGSGGAAGIDPTVIIVVNKCIKGPGAVKVLPFDSPDSISGAIKELGTAAIEMMSNKGKCCTESEENKEKDLLN